MIPKLQLVKCARQNSSRHQGLGKIFTIEETNKQKMEEDKEEGGGGEEIESTDILSIDSVLYQNTR